LGISFQAVSKWERGEAYPDISILTDLADVLETTTDYLLRSGEPALSFKGKFNVSDMIDGINSLKAMGDLLGKENIIYRSAVSGINEGMNKISKPRLMMNSFLKHLLQKQLSKI